MAKNTTNTQKMYIYIGKVKECEWDDQMARTLKALREARCTQKELAMKVAQLGGNCSERNIRKLESAESKSIMMKNIMAICEVLGVKPSIFLDVRVLGD